MSVQWSLVLFTLLSGTGAWMFALVCLDKLRGAAEEARSAVAASIVSLVLVAGGGLASVAHLSHPDRMLAALNHPTSGIFVEAVLIGLLALAIVVFAVAIKRGASSGALKAIAVVGIALAAALSFAMGNSYCMEARAAWNTPLLPLAYLLTAASCGAAARLVVLAVLRQDVGTVSFSGMALGVVSALSSVVVLAYGVAAGMFGGEQAMLYGGLALFVGALVPAALGFAACRKPATALGMGVVSLAAAVIGAAAFRAAMWLIGTGVADYFGMIY